MTEAPRTLDQALGRVIARRRHIPDWLDQLLVAFVQRAIAPRIDCTTVRPGQLAQIRNGGAQPSPAFRAAIERASVRRR